MTRHKIHPTLFVVAKSAQTLDGKIATANGDSKWITSPAARQYARRQRDRFDAILVGINTVLKDDPRLAGVRKRNLKKIVLDSRLRISVKARLLRNVVDGQVLIVTTSSSSERKIKALREKGAQVLVCGQQHGKINIKRAFELLAAQGITKILIEGGAQVIGGALMAGLVNQMHIYIAPKILGDKTALSSVVGLRATKIGHAAQLKNVRVKKIGSNILIQGDI